MKPLPNLDEKMDAVIIAVAHRQFKEMTIGEIQRLLNNHPVLIDVRGMVQANLAQQNDIYYKRL